MLTNANTTDTQKGIKSIENNNKTEAKILNIITLSYTLHYITQQKENNQNEDRIENEFIIKSGRKQGQGKKLRIFKRF